MTPEIHIPRAVLMLHALLTDLNTSSWYHTHPLRPTSGNDFVNGVISGRLPDYGRSTSQRTEMALELRDSLRTIETALGRVRSADTHAARTIDLDILLFGDTMISTEPLTIPDPDIIDREFLSVPLRELDPTLIIPGLHVSISEIAPLHHTMRLLPLFSREIRLRCLEHTGPVRSREGAESEEHPVPTWVALQEELYGHR